MTSVITDIKMLKIDKSRTTQDAIFVLKQVGIYT